MEDAEKIHFLLLYVNVYATQLFFERRHEMAKIINMDKIIFKMFIDEFIGSKPLDISFEDILDAGYMGVDEDEHRIILSATRMLDTVSEKVIPAIKKRVAELDHDFIGIDMDEKGNPCGIKVLEIVENK